MVGEEGQGTAWLPPLEGRELGSGPDGSRYRLSSLSRAVLVTGAAVLALVVIGRVISVAAGPQQDSPIAVAEAFVDARVKGDAAGACGMLTPRAQRDMVALVRGIEAPDASAQDCPRYVLQVSEASEFTDPALPRFRDHELRTLHWPGAEGRRYAEVKADGVPGAVLELQLVGGSWKLDGLAAERVSFIAGCTDHGARRDYCGCTFEKLADVGRASHDELAAMSRDGGSGSVPPVLAQAAAACGH